METGKPSRTAWAAAMHRAAHQVVEGGFLFADALALRVLGVSEAEVREKAAGEAQRKMRMFIAMRTRFAEDALAAAVATGTTQVVVLGAGLDTFAYRSPYGDGVRVFEVDFPATQAWKRERLGEAGIEVPGWVTYVGVDFERETLEDGMARAGFDAGRQTFFTWLGVVPYLREEAVFATLGYIAGLKGGAEVVFDYGDPPETLDAAARAYHDARAARVAAVGESWVTYFEAGPLRARLLRLGFLEVEDLRPGQMVERFFPGRGQGAARRGGHVLRAWTV